jgi:lipopolysaccharide/colanic/teichoic acid biosynthesis glycosyltransferase
VDARNYHLRRPVHLAQSVADEELPPRATSNQRQFATSPEKSDGSPVTPGLPWYLPLKRCCDLGLALALLIVSAPVVLLAALLVKLTSRGPALYRQTRVGLDGRHFVLLKLRTMKHNAEADTGPVWSTENDGRVTAVGSLLRRTHIDEFPQLLNVLRGEMSLVGPRPERPEFVAKLDWEIPYYRERLKVRPGITGLAQLRLRADTSLESVRQKVVNDVYYVRHVNPALDGKLLVMTAWRLLNEVLGFFWKFFTLPNPAEVERGFHRAVGIECTEAVPDHVTLASISGGGNDEGFRARVAEFPREEAAVSSRPGRLRSDGGGL